MARIIQHNWVNGGGDTEAPSVTELDNGHVLIIANADTDADGAPDAEIIDPPYGSKQTSLCAPSWKGQGEYVNSRTVPYFVLPLNWPEISAIDIRLGDLAKITYKGKCIYAIFADKGPDKSIGEISIAAIEALGGNPWSQDGSRIVSGLSYGVTYEIIPGSRDLDSTIDFETIQSVGMLAFRDHPQIKKAEKYSDVTWLEMNRTSEGRPTITAYKAGSPLYTHRIKGKADLVNFLNLFPNARSVLVAETNVKAIPDCLDTEEIPSPLPGSNSLRFANYFKENYESVRSEVNTWFTKGPENWSSDPIANGCVAHQVSCLHLCGLPAPIYDSEESVNVVAFIKWAKNHGYSVVNDMSALQPGDICVSASRGDDYDHVYCFYSYRDTQNANVLHNQVFGLAKRSLVGSWDEGAWRFALRMP